MAMAFLGCAPMLPKPMADNENGNLLSGICHRASQAVLNGDANGWHDCFFASYSRARDPMLGGEDLESIAATLTELLAKAGDDQFAAALAKETPPVRAGVAYFLSANTLALYPKTKAVVASTPDYDFELEKASRAL